MPVALLVLIAFVILVLNIKATLLLTHSSYYGATQKALQLALVWLVPVLGAALVWSLVIDTPRGRFTTDLRDYSGNDDGYIRSDSSASDIEGGDAGGGE